MNKTNITFLSPLVLASILILLSAIGLQAIADDTLKAEDLKAKDLKAKDLKAKDLKAEDSKAQPALPTVSLKLKDKVLKTEIANTADQRYMGLSFRTNLAEDEAMLFAYTKEQRLVFTMRNTLLPLSIAYISKDLVINEIHLMPVGKDLLFPATKPAKFALEVNQGWFKRNGIGVGTQIELIR